jgi:murein L,D-transpeptidase YafK
MLNTRTLVRALVTSAVLATGFILAGCNSDEISLASNAKANKPIPEKLIAAMQEKDMDPQSPILIRLFKTEAELEVWKQNRSGQFALLQTYPICRWSGDLGPKVREGDRQAPEGFYDITRAQMNPQSAYYLSFNTGFPNAFDKSLGRTGSELMVHGDCSSRGCYAMTDEQISDIYTLGRESFFGGQRAFQFQAYPFRMTPVNMAKHRDNPNMPFWKMIKEGYDHFEVTKQQPHVEFCENKYVFDPVAPPNASHPPVFNASAKCPAYVIPDEIAEPVREKQRQDDAKIAELVAKGIPVAQRRPDIDGGMNRIFAAKIPDASTGLSESDGPGLQTASFSKLPGTIPPTVNPPRSAATPPASDVATAAPVAAPATRVASATPDQSDGFFSSLARKVGLASNTDTTASAPPPAAPTTPTKPARASTKPKVMEAKNGAPPKATESKVAAARPAAKPADAVAADAAAAAPAVAGSQPVVSANSFDTRWQSVH